MKELNFDDEFLRVGKLHHYLKLILQHNLLNACDPIRDIYIVVKELNFYDAISSRNLWHKVLTLQSIYRNITIYRYLGGIEWVKK